MGKVMSSRYSGLVLPTMTRAGNAEELRAPKTYAVMAYCVVIVILVETVYVYVCMYMYVYVCWKIATHVL